MDGQATNEVYLNIIKVSVNDGIHMMVYPVKAFTRFSMFMSMSIVAAHST